MIRLGQPVLVSADLPDGLRDIPAKFWTETLGFQPYLRDEDTLSRPWVVPGTPGLEHRVGGLEKDYNSGNISYVPTNHERMIRVRASKIERIADELDPPEIMGNADADTLLVSWGSTYGSMFAVVKEINASGKKVAHIHLRHLSPFPANLGELLGRYERILVPEMNSGQLVTLLRSTFLLPAEGLSKVAGRPFKIAEIEEAITSRLGEAE